MYSASAVPICRWFERQAVCRAFSRAWAKTGNKMAASIAIIAITTSNSIKVKPTCRRMGEPPSPRVRHDLAHQAVPRTPGGFLFVCQNVERGAEGRGTGGQRRRGRAKGAEARRLF